MAKIEADNGYIEAIQKTLPQDVLQEAQNIVAAHRPPDIPDEFQPVMHNEIKNSRGEKKVIADDEPIPQGYRLKKHYNDEERIAGPVDLNGTIYYRVHSHTPVGITNEGIPFELKRESELFEDQP